MSVNNDQVLNALRGIDDPAGGDVVSSGVVRALNISGGDVKFVMEVDPARAPEYADAKTRAEEVVRSLPGVVSVSVVLTAHSAKAPPDLKPTARPKPQGPENIPGVKHIIAIASGKGGVGKSTVASNIACALAARGRNVGLLDADLYGPSQPRMMGATGRPDSPDGKIITPKLTHGVKMMSIGLMMEEGQSVVWRGPMLMGALQQLLTQVEWGHLDTLIVDLPPGTGDVQLSLAQKTVVDGAIVVSTPQDVALLDARKGIDMFGKLNVPILGLVENMSTHVCSNCGHEEHVFGHGGVADEAAKLGVPLLAEVPLHIDVRLAGDSGVPGVVSDPDSAAAKAFDSIAGRMIDTGVA